MQSQSILDMADYDTFNRVEGLDEAESAEEAIEALIKELDAKTQELSELKDALNQAEDEARNLADEAERLADEAEQSGISSDGDINLYVNSKSKSASVGSSDNALGVNAEGDVKMTTGKGTTLKNVNLESGGDVSLTPIKAAEAVRIDAVGNITAAKGSGGTSITAPLAELNSLKGNVGSSKADPLRISVDSVSASGVNVWIRNDKDVMVDIVAENDVGLTVDGDIRGDGDPNTYDIIGGNVSVDAGGDIGSKNTPLGVESDKFGANGKNIYLASDSNVTIDRINASGDVVINTAGSVADTGKGIAIKAKNLAINAGGGIGTANNPLDIYIRKNVNLNARYGHIFVLRHKDIPRKPREDEKSLNARPEWTDRHKNRFVSKAI